MKGKTVEKLNRNLTIFTQENERKEKKMQGVQQEMNRGAAEEKRV